MQGAASSFQIVQQNPRQDLYVEPAVHGVGIILLVEFKLCVFPAMPEVFPVGEDPRGVSGQLPRTRAIGIMSTISIAIEALLNNVLLKNIIARTRPYDDIDGLVCLVGRQMDYSFPSGHTGAAFAVAGAMLVVALFGLPIIEKTGEITREDASLTFKLVSVLLIMYATLLAFSRMYVGVHYPTDVLCGLLLGLGTSATAYLIYQIAIKKIHDRKAKIKEA